MIIQKSIQYGISFIFILTMIILMISGNWERQLLLGSGFIFCYIPWAFEKIFAVNLPRNSQLVTVLFIFASQYLGSFVQFYALIPWWDAALHFFSGFLLAYWGIIITLPLDRSCVLYNEKRIGLILLIALLTSMASVSAWEMIEFFGDTCLGTNAQLGSLRDTMEDIICGTIGGGLFALYIGTMMSRGKRCLVDKLYEANRSSRKAK